MNLRGLQQWKLWVINWVKKKTANGVPGKHGAQLETKSRLVKMKERVWVYASTWKYCYCHTSEGFSHKTMKDNIKSRVKSQRKHRNQTEWMSHVCFCVTASKKFMQGSSCCSYLYCMSTCISVASLYPHVFVWLLARCVTVCVHPRVYNRAAVRRIPASE